MKTLVILVLTLGIVSVIANPVSKQTIQSENKNPAQAETSESQTQHVEVINTLNKGDQKQKKDTLIENPATPNIDFSKDFNEKVEIIIEEDVISPTDEGPNLSEDCPPVILQQGGPQLADFNEDNPQIPASFVGGPQLSGDFESDSPAPFPGFIGEGQMSKLNTDLQPGFVAESPQVSGFVEGIEQLPGIIGDITQLPGLDNDPQLPEDDEDDFIIDKDYFREDMQKIEHEIMETAAGFVPTPLVFRRKQKPRRRFVTRRHFRRNPYRRHQFIYPFSYYAFYRPSSLRYY